MHPYTVTLLLMKACCVLSTLISGVSAVDHDNKTLTLGLLAPFSNAWNLGQQIGSAMIPAIDKVGELGLLPGYHIDWIIGDTGCTALTGFRATVEMWEQTDGGLDALIGGACSVVCQPVALLAAAWNLPMISYTCMSSALSDKSQYPTFARLVDVAELTAPIADALVDAFGWSRCAVVTTTQEVWAVGAAEVRRVLENSGKLVYSHTVQTATTGGMVDEEAVAAQREVVQMVKDEARLVVLYMYWEDARVFLLNAMDEGMLNGEYIFYTLYITNFIYVTATYRPTIPNEELFVGVIILEMPELAGDDWEQLKVDVVEGFNDPMFDSYDCIDSAEEVPSYAGYLYDTVLLWAFAVNATLNAGDLAQDGEAVIGRTFNYSFEGVTDTVNIDYKGDRRIDNRLSIVQPDQKVVQIFQWHAVRGDLEKVYKAGSANDWSGIIWSGGATSMPSGQPPCGWQDDLCPQASFTMPAAIGIGVGGVVLILTMVFLVYQFKRHLDKTLQQEIDRCIIDRSQITIPHERQQALSEGVDGPVQGATHRYTCLVQGVERVVEEITDHNKVGSLRVDSTLRQEISRVRSLSHDNINQFIGISIKFPSLIIIEDHASRGSLRDLIDCEEEKLSWDFKISFITDLTNGLRYLHQSALDHHGRLTSDICVVDKRWVCKIGGAGFTAFRRLMMADETSRSLWTAPEILRGESTSTKNGDIYALGIIMYEIISSSPPYSQSEDDLEGSAILSLVRDGTNPPFRPQLGPWLCGKEWVQVVNSCWSEEPSERPSCDSLIRMIIKTNHGDSPNLIDKMIRNLETHTQELEEHVEERSQEIRGEQEKMSILLSELLPQSVINQMKAGKAVEPEAFDSATIFFSDIVGFTRVSSKSTALQVISMLNTLYSIFDLILMKYDTYKVATIGDAYVVASGVPVKNDDRHAREICQMSLELMDSIKGFEIPHLTGESLYMRIGIHTGPCVAAVTGIKTPRYLLFGETIDIASRIEAGGEAMKIHISQATADLLSSEDEFEIEARGEMPIKGVGSIATYWLIGLRNQSVI